MRRLIVPVVPVVVVFLPVLFVSEVVAAPRGYYRFPTIRGGTIVFGAEGDLWRVPVGGGAAQRLTSHLAEEEDPALSPDGKTVAFSAAYEGASELYTMPLEGGLPTRHTWDGEPATALGWTPDGRVLYTTRKHSGLPDTRLVALDPRSQRREILPLAQASDGCREREGGPLIFTRFTKQGSQTQRYKGGWIQSLWSFAPGAAEATPLTADWSGTSAHPMCWNGRVYFASDRDDTINLWSMRPDGTDLRQHTHHAGWDVKDPAIDDGRIVYQLGADLRLLDVRSGEDREIPIVLSSDLDQLRERWVEKPMDYLTAARLSPDGDRVVLTARGEVFVLPAKPGQGREVHVTRRSGVRYRQARFLPDGKSLVALSDESGEVEWWRLSATGLEPPQRITNDAKVLRFDGVVSPDGKWIAHYDQDQELWLTRVEGGQSTRIDFSPNWSFDDPAWSPDSAWLAWARPGENGLLRIYLHDVARGETVALTSDRYDSWSAVWSPDGKWLYFLSDRDFTSLVGSPWGSRQPQPFFDRQTKIYAAALVPGLRSPFQPHDELAPPEDDKKKDTEKGKDKAKEEDGDEGQAKGKDKNKDESKDAEKKPPKVRVELEGLKERILELPVPRDNMAGLFVNDEYLFWMRRDTSGERKRQLMVLEIDNEKPEPVALVDDAQGFEPSLDRKKLLVRVKDRLHVIEAGKDKPDLDDTAVALDGWSFSIDPREEWRQMFVESWRLERDYFYDRAMHGVNWKAVLAKYLPLVERVTSRGELSDLQAQMAGELSALHIFVYGGDQRESGNDVDPASLGAALARDEGAGGWRVEHVFRTDPDDPARLAPLARPGVDVREGDVILEINGTDTLSVAHPALLLRNQAGKQVRLLVRPSGAGKATRDVIVVPVGPDDEARLRYSEWEYTRRLRVEERSAGKIGYLHLRAMGGRDIGTWYRDFYAVFDRPGLVIDVRHNSGGNIDSWILEKLMRRAWFYWQPRVGRPYWNMQQAFRGHVVVLIDEATASDGEAFSEGFRRLGLGPLIGTRTWGGEIWLTSSNVLVDEGIVTAAEFGVYGPEGDWLIEGHGVEPDVVVDNLPHATFRGEDAQLDAAIERLEELILEDPRPVPPAPAYPNKARPGER
jgi:tricorn protease